MTTNHSLSTPAEGSSDWDDPLNNNFRAIDGKLPIVDVEANLGSYDPVEDGVFHAYNTGNVFRADGSSWNQVPAPDLNLDDNEAITFGTDDDFSMEYDATNGYFQIRDEDGGVDSLRFTGTGDISIPNGDILLPTRNEISHGETESITITETSSPTGFTISEQNTSAVIAGVTVTLTNPSGAQITEDVTVTIYDGTDATGTSMDTATSSVTISASTTSDEVFGGLAVFTDDGDYFIEVTTSGTDFTVDESDVSLEGVEYATNVSGTGILQSVSRTSISSAESCVNIVGRTLFPPGVYVGTAPFAGEGVRKHGYRGTGGSSIVRGGEVRVEKWGSGDWGQIEFQKYRGDLDSLSATQDDELIGNFRASGVDTSGNESRIGTLQFSQDGSATSNGVGGKIRLRPANESETENDALVARKDWTVEIPNGEIHLSDALNLDPIAEPASPSNGHRLFVDSADGSLKSKDSAGTVTTIVS